jgi:hypothetical protein
MFDPGTGTWYLRYSASPGAPDVTPFSYGGPGWKPVVGDWAGAGRTTVGVVDPGGTWYLRDSNASGAPDVTPFAYGLGGWTPLAGAWQPAAQAQLADGEGPGAPALTAGPLKSAVAAALTRLRSAGVGPTLLQRLASAQYQVGDLPAGTLGLTDVGANRVVLSADAAGHGWLVDRTPLADEAFAAGLAPPGSPAAGREDLLSVVLHEMAHLAGRPDDASPPGSTDLLAEVLPVGQRRTQDLDQVFATGL